MTPTPQLQPINEAQTYISPGFDSSWKQCEPEYVQLKQDVVWKGFLQKPNYPWDNPPQELAELAKVIKASKELTSILDDSEFGGPKPPDNTTWVNGCKFLWKLGEELNLRLEKVIDPPHISPTSAGGLSLCWDREDYRMLITIHPDNGSATYYGDDTKWKNTRKGETTVSGIDLSLIAWFGGVK